MSLERSMDAYVLMSKELQPIMDLASLDKVFMIMIAIWLESFITSQAQTSSLDVSD